MEAWIQKPSEPRRQRLWDLLGRMRDQQNEYQRIKWGSVRLINDRDLLLFEYALQCLLNPEDEAGQWAYQTARHYAERFDSRHGNGLISTSVPLLKDIARNSGSGISPQPGGAFPAGQAKKPADKSRSSPKAAANTADKRNTPKPRFTYRQGQFLISFWVSQAAPPGACRTGQVEFFRVTPPSAHGMVVKLEQLGLVTRQQGLPRSIRVAIAEVDILPLEDVEGSPW